MRTKRIFKHNRRNKKKAQIQSQVFVYLGALIGISLFMVYAFKFLIAYQKNIYSSEMISFMKDFKNDAEQMALKYKSSQTFTYRNVPDGYSQICFVDLVNYPTVDTPPLNNYPVINMAIKTLINLPSANFKDVYIMNVYLIKNGIAQAGFYVPNMKVNNKFFCENITSGHFKVVMKGWGDSVELLRAS